MNVNHVDLQVSDVDAARAFFESLFDLRCIFQRRSELAMLEDESGFSLAVSNLFNSPPPTYPPDFHIGFILESEAQVRAQFKRLTDAGVPMKADLSVGGPNIYFMCIGPDGILVEVRGPLGHGAANRPNEAAVPNPALEAFHAVVGHWSTLGKHPLVPDKTFHGTATFEWLYGGAFLLVHTATDEPEIPSGLAIIGSDDSTREFFMLYFDERGVSRKYDVEIHADGFSWSRSTAEFSQRFTIAVGDDGKTMLGTGEMLRHGGAWEPDLQLSYDRLA